MKRVKIEKLDVVMPKNAKKDVILVSVRDIEDTLVFDFIAKDKLQVRYCITDNDYAAYIPEDSASNFSLIFVFHSSTFISLFPIYINYSFIL